MKLIISPRQYVFFLIFKAKINFAKIQNINLNYKRNERKNEFNENLEDLLFSLCL